MKTRNGLSSLFEFLDDFVAHRHRIREQFWIRHWQLLSTSLVPDRALNVAFRLQCTIAIPPRREDAPASAQGESGMSKAGPDNHKQDGEIGHRHGATSIGTLRKIYGQGFAAGYPPTDKLSDVFLNLNETSLSQLRRDYKTGHLVHKITNALH
jgi:hypothetical protein